LCLATNRHDSKDYLDAEMNNGLDNRMAITGIIRMNVLQTQTVPQVITRQIHDAGIKLKVKVNFTLEQATKTERGSRGITLFFL
jgi:hypothetical protein